MAKKTETELKDKLESAMRAFYQRYYRDQLGLVDWEARIENRLDEENWLGEPQVSRVEDWRNMSFRGLKVLIVGAGTGAESVVLHQRGAEVHGIEPDNDAFEILQMKATLHGFPADRFQQAVAEDLPYEENTFDFVYCYTVLEHVQNVEASIDEMIRVCKIKGTVYIQTPDYRFPYEAHYKSARLPYSPKWLTMFQFWFQGKPVEFLRTVNFLTGPGLDRIFMSHKVLVKRINQPWVRYWHEIRNRIRLQYWFLKSFGIPRDQNIFLAKLN